LLPLLLRLLMPLVLLQVLLTQVLLSQAVLLLLLLMMVLLLLLLMLLLLLLLLLVLMPRLLHLRLLALHDMLLGIWLGGRPTGCRALRGRLLELRQRHCRGWLRCRARRSIATGTTRGRARSACTTTSIRAARVVVAQVGHDVAHVL